MAIPAEQQLEINGLLTEIAILERARTQRALAGTSVAIAGRNQITVFESGRLERQLREKRERINFLSWAYDDGEEGESSGGHSIVMYLWGQPTSDHPTAVPVDAVTTTDDPTLTNLN